MTHSFASHPSDILDVVVVGGGPAGLAAAVALGRSRRSVLVLDAGDPRNAVADGVHNYLSREGTPPRDLLAAGRAEAASYGVQVTHARVVAVRAWDRPGTGFVVTPEGGAEVLARRLVVASGVRDELPALPGLAERWGRDVLHCAYCHGWEVRDRRIAVLATGPLAAHHALLFRQLTDDVVLVPGPGGTSPGEEDLARLSARGVRVLTDAAVEVVTDGDALVGLRLGSEDVLERDAVVVSPVFGARADFLEGLGLGAEPFELAGTVLGSVVPAEPTGATAVAGLHLAGNVTDPMAQVVSSAAAGLRTGSVVNAELVEEDARAALDDHADWLSAFTEQPGWDERYGGAEDVWSGRVNPQLAAETADLAPGTALDVGCGEGADVTWLAARGWTVTGLDFSPVGLGRAAAHAAEQGVAERTSWVRADLRDDEVPAGSYDLVTSQFVHLPGGAMVDLTRRLARAVAPSGTLLVVGHHPDGLPDQHAGHRSFLFTPADLLPALPEQEWEVQVAEVRGRVQHGPDGEPVRTLDSVLRARRR